MLNKKIKHISNLIIVSLILIVSLFSSLPERAITISSGESYRAIYNGDRDSKYVSLMINVYENGEVVKEMLDLFKEEGVVATFFVGGCWADDNCEILKRIINEGHELGNHGYFHKDHKKLSENSNYNEIYNCDKIVSSLTGYKMTLFAPPSGSFSKTTLKIAKNLGYQTIMWSKDTIDWRDSDVNVIVSRATKSVEGGDFILMHPKPHTLSALFEIIKIIKQKGLSFSTVSDLL